jgi:hypothetical protein
MSRLGDVGVCGRDMAPEPVFSVRPDGRLHYPIPSSSEDSSAVPQRRQITDEQSPQVSGSFTSSAQFGQ